MMMNAAALTVSQLNEYVKALLDSSELLYDVTVKGELSNFKNHYASGHLYFSLKDSSARLQAVMFRQNAMRLKFRPEDGMKVLARGNVSVYQRDGVYQLYVTEMQPDGIGALYLAYEQLRARLSEEGLFDDAHKKPIPRYPNRIGIITAKDSAAAADLRNILSRRFPLAELLFYPALVQGDDAPAALCAGIRYFNRFRCVDTIIIARGGGSLEDLWAFNDERLAREIYASEIPVISGVGHETDYTICDFVADRRAPTPSAAAELAVPDRYALCNGLAAAKDGLSAVMEKKISDCRTALSRAASRRMFLNPYDYVDRMRTRVDRSADALTSAADACIRFKKGELSSRSSAIAALSPLSVLARGYSIVSRKEDGKAVTDAASLAAGQTLHMRFHKGAADAVVTQIVEGGKRNARSKEKTGKDV